MIVIPQNDSTYDFEKKVEEAISAVLADQRFRHFGFSDCLKMNHVSANKEWGEVYVLYKEADEVARRFKMRGYHAHYCHSVNGRAYCLTITTYPTNNDI